MANAGRMQTVCGSVNAATVSCQGTETVEQRYYLSSLPLGVATFAKAVRGHWSVENSLHWVATLWRLALNLLKREAPKKRGIRGKQINASWNHAYLLRLLGVPI